MKKWHIILLIFSLTVNVAVVATLVYFWQRQEPDRRPRRMPPEWVSDLRFLEKDSLQAPAEPGKIVRLRREYLRDLREKRHAIEDSRKEILVLLLRQDPSRDSIEVMLQTMTQQQIDAEKLTIDHLLELRDLLPPPVWRELVHSLQARQPGRSQRVILERGRNMPRNGMPMPNEEERHIIIEREKVFP